MTAGLILPFAGSYPITQGFAGHNLNEPKGILTSDANGPLSSKLVLVRSTAPGYFAHLHAAIDWATPNGTKLRAMESGVVVAGGVVARFGDGSIDGEIFQILQIHRDAVSQTLILMTHLMKRTVATGSHVTKGQTIAISNNTGRSTGPHDHVQLVTGSRFLSPAALMWGTAGTRWNIVRLLEGHDQAWRKFLIPNV
jgi:murein DD-endopeptidase MepM/ murein hydrolase activator NlpD